MGVHLRGGHWWRILGKWLVIAGYCCVLMTNLVTSFIALFWSQCMFLAGFRILQIACNLVLRFIGVIGLMLCFNDKT